MNILLVDNYDSFTFNLRSLVWRASGAVPAIVKNDEDPSVIDFDRFDAVLISPGPGTPLRPTDIGITANVLEMSDLPILGVCLGHQAICAHHGASVAHAPNPMHGRISTITHNGDPLFKGIPSQFEAVRYHSLASTGLPDHMTSIATCEEDGVLMGARHRELPQWGVQFHPESILTQHGETLIRNFVELAARYRRQNTISRVSSPRADEQPAPSAESGSRATVYKLQAVDTNVWAEPSVVFRRLFGESSYAFWLDSSDDANEIGRFSYMGDASGPSALTILHHVGAGSSLFDGLDRELKASRVESDHTLPFSFRLGYVGYFGYEMKAETGNSHVHSSKNPDSQLMFADRAVVFDHADRTVWLMTLNEDDQTWLTETASVIKECLDETPSVPDEPNERSVQFEQRRSRDEYLVDIERCKALIRDGESYEICLTNMLQIEPLEDPLKTYLELRRISPTPHGAYFRFDDLHILSSSPERFICIDAAGNVEAKPIKGTAARSIDAATDHLLAQGLHSEKEHAENLMIVDLLRNDLAVVCATGSVSVPALFDIETFSGVHQLVSTITGTLRSDASSVQCVRSAFPGGSMTGAPKTRTVQIIDDIETAARGIYSGILGYFSLDGAADWSMVIRTIVDSPEGTFIGVGGAITALSEPEDEYAETMLKAKNVLKAIAATTTM